MGREQIYLAMEIHIKVNIKWVSLTVLDSINGVMDHFTLVSLKMA